MNPNEIDRRMLDRYEEFFHDGQEAELFKAVTDMEANSEWLPGLIAKDIRLEAIDNRPMFIMDDYAKYHFETPEEIALAEDTAAESGTGLVIYTGSKIHTNGRCHELVRKTAIAGIERVAKLSGSALGRMPGPLYAETMNNAFSVAQGSALGLIRYGKLSGLHSGADGGYMVMPISKLLDISADSLARKFGETHMRKGYNSHSFTRALWELPDAQDKLIDLYQKAIGTSGIQSQYALNFMPGVDFHSSDTAGSCAVLDPVFFYGRNKAIHFCEGIRIKHLRRGDAREKAGMELFEEGALDLFAKFQDTAKLIAELSAKKIYHAENCVIKLCKKFSISAKYGSAALEEVERIAAGEPYISAHDMYLALYEAVAEAESSEASSTVIGQIEESLMRIAKITDFSEYDVAGTVAWKD